MGTVVLAVPRQVVPAVGRARMGASICATVNRAPPVRASRFSRLYTHCVALFTLALGEVVEVSPAKPATRLGRGAARHAKALVAPVLAESTILLAPVLQPSMMVLCSSSARSWSCSWL